MNKECGSVLEEVVRKLLVSANKMIYARASSRRDAYYLESLRHLENAEGIINEWMARNGNQVKVSPPLKYGDVTGRKGYPPNELRKAAQ
jgi:hypothetical protein